MPGRRFYLPFSCAPSRTKSHKPQNLCHFRAFRGQVAAASRFFGRESGPVTENRLPNAGFSSALSAKGMAAFWDAADWRLRALVKLSQGVPIRTRFRSAAAARRPATITPLCIRRPARVRAGMGSLRLIGEQVDDLLLRVHFQFRIDVLDMSANGVGGQVQSLADVRAASSASK